jgi:hypothetical protein
MRCPAASCLASRGARGPATSHEVGLRPSVRPSVCPVPCHLLHSIHAAIHASTCRTPLPPEHPRMAPIGKADWARPLPSAWCLDDYCMLAQQVNRDAGKSTRPLTLSLLLTPSSGLSLRMQTNGWLGCRNRGVRVCVCVRAGKGAKDEAADDDVAATLMDLAMTAFPGVSPPPTAPPLPRRRVKVEAEPGPSAAMGRVIEMRRMQREAGGADGVRVIAAPSVRPSICPSVRTSCMLTQPLSPLILSVCLSWES